MERPDTYILVYYRIIMYIANNCFILMWGSVMKIINEKNTIKHSFYNYYALSFILVFIISNVLCYILANKFFYNRLLNNATSKTDIIKGDINATVDSTVKSYLRSFDDSIIYSFDKFYNEGNDLNTAIKKVTNVAMLNNSIDFLLLDNDGKELYSKKANYEAILKDVKFNDINSFEEKFFEINMDGEAYIYHMDESKPWNKKILSGIKKKDFKNYVLNEYLKLRIAGYTTYEEYTYVIDLEGNLIIHPFKTNDNIYNLKDVKGNYVIKEMIEKRQGTIKYKLDVNYGEESDVRIAQYSYVNDLEWIVVTSISEEEAINKNIRGILAGLLIVLLIGYIFVIVINLFIIDEVTEKIISLDKEITDYLVNKHVIKLNYKNKNEVYKLKESFDGLMKKTKEYSNSLVQKNSELENEINNRENIIRESLAELKDKNQKEENIRDMSNMLQNCHSEIEMCEVLEYTLPNIFDNTSGQFYIKNKYKSFFSIVNWGLVKGLNDMVSEDCWALKTNYTYFRSGKYKPMCNHYKSKVESYICFPIFYEGEIIGVLNVVSDKELFLGKDKGEFRRLCTMVGETIAINLSNIRIKEQLRKISIMDALTGTLNRRYLEDIIMKDKIEKDTAVIMLDIDNFKKINDKYGHVIGDRVLLKLAEIVKNTLREEDIFLRYGGEEFLLIIKNIDKNKAITFGEYVREQIEEKLSIEEYGVKCTASLGLSYNSKRGASIGDNIKEADEYLYKAKENGKNKLVYSI